VSKGSASKNLDAFSRLRGLHSAFVPTVLREGPYRVYFYSNESGEPPHVHIDHENATAKFWLDPVVLASNVGFSARELGSIEEIVNRNRKRLIRAWHEHFGI